jgi:hypothetical protein
MLACDAFQPACQLTQFEVGGSAIAPERSPIFDRQVLPDLVQRSSVKADSVFEFPLSKEFIALLFEARRDF